MKILADWTPAAKAKRDRLIAADPKLKFYFASTYEALVSGQIGIPVHGHARINVFGTQYYLELDVETDRIAKIKFVDIEDVT